MHQNLLATEFESGEYLNAWDKKMHVIGVIKTLTKESRQMPGSFCCTYAVNWIFRVRVFIQKYQKLIEPFGVSFQPIR